MLSHARAASSSIGNSARAQPTANAPAASHELALSLVEREDADRDDEESERKPERRQGPVNRALVIDDLLEPSRRGHWERQGDHG
jgi:hypothetical protein